jgi:hypothetical protein
MQESSIFCPSGPSAKRVDKPEQAAANPFGVDVSGCRIDHFAAWNLDQCHDWSSLFKSHNFVHEKN